MAYVSANTTFDHIKNLLWKNYTVISISDCKALPAPGLLFTTDLYLFTDF